MVFTKRQTIANTSHYLMDSSILKALKVHMDSTVQKNESTLQNVISRIQKRIDKDIKSLRFNIMTKFKSFENNITRRFKLFVKKYNRTELFKGSSSALCYNLNMRTNLILSSMKLIMNNNRD